MVRVQILNSDQRSLGAAEVTPGGALNQLPANAVDPPEEVVRREKDQVAAEVTVALDCRIDVGRHVFLVARKHDQVVPQRELVAAHLLEVVLGEDVDLAARAREPLLERQVELPKTARYLRCRGTGAGGERS